MLFVQCVCYQTMLPLLGYSNRDISLLGYPRLLFRIHTIKFVIPKALKEYYEIVGESRPLSAFFPTHADFFTEIHFYS